MKEGQQLTALAQTEVTKEELDVEEGVRAVWGPQGRLQLLWGNTLYHRDDLPFAGDMSDLPDVFTPFRNKVLVSPLQHVLPVHFPGHTAFVVEHAQCMHPVFL